MKTIRHGFWLAIGLSFSPFCNAIDNYTDVSAYLFASGTQGEVAFANTQVDVDASFGDILKQLDIGLMGSFEHRINQWVFIGDLFYVGLSAEESRATNAVNLTIEAEFNQLLFEGFVGYPIYESGFQDNHLIIDLLGGIRYNNLELKLNADATFLNTVVGATASRDTDWIDGVIGIRAIQRLSRCWSVSGWADYGKGSDSHSYQLGAFASYHFENNFRLFAGYRWYHFGYQANNFNELTVDLDYKGPMLGLTYRFGSQA